MPEESRISSQGAVLSQRETNILKVLPLVRRIAEFRLRGTFRTASEDIVQKVGLSLWRWSSNRNFSASVPPDDDRVSSLSLVVGKADKTDSIDQTAHDDEDFSSDFQKLSSVQDEKSVVGDSLYKSLTDSRHLQIEKMTEDDWRRLAQVVTRHEINSFFRSKYRRERQLSEVVAETELPFRSRQDFASGKHLGANLTTQGPEGGSRAEMASILCCVWNIVSEMSLRQKYSLLLQKDWLIINLLTHDCCSRAEIAAALDCTKAEFDAIFINLPLTDEAIAGLIEQKINDPVSVRQVWMARGKARAKLAAGMRPLIE